jgi:hypothetical protein
MKNGEPKEVILFLNKFMCTMKEIKECNVIVLKKVVYCIKEIYAEVKMLLEYDDIMLTCYYVMKLRSDIICK